MRRLLQIVVLLFGSLSALSQPITNIGPIANLDFDSNGSIDLLYSSNAEKTREFPEDWMIGFNVQPWGVNRFLMASSSRISFKRGESINQSRRALTNYFENPPRPRVETFGISLLYYRAILSSDWQYSTIEPAFEGDSEMIFGLRLSFESNVHYGWVHFRRPFVNSYTQFELVDFAFHPVPNEPINAGDQAPLPPINTQLQDNSLLFTWDSRWGSLVLESCTNLVSPVVWETVGEGSGSQVAIDVSNEQRFFRLRAP